MEDFLYGADGLASGVSERSFNTQLAQIKRFVEWMIRRRIMDPIVLDAMKPLEYDRRQYLQLGLPELVRMVEDQTDPYNRFVIAFGLQTLGRGGELLSRQWRHVDLTAGRIEWFRNKTSKTRNGRDTLPITADLDSELREWMICYQGVCGPIQPDWYLIPRRRGSPKRGWIYCPEHHKVAVSKIIQRAAQVYAPDLDLTGQGAHILRRSAARALYERLLELGEPDPIRIVQAMLGHASSKTTELYLDIRKDREKRDAVLRGASLLSMSAENVIELRAVNG